MSGVDVKRTLLATPGLDVDRQARRLIPDLQRLRVQNGRCPTQSQRDGECPVYSEVAIRRARQDETEHSYIIVFPIVLSDRFR